ncbi:hypothetical protein DFH06DRAFT_1129788 [Mycena polygramma]|nr:hypothetical protein DFH06DRAFT_1129788 [Mycena polygramma]
MAVGWRGVASYRWCLWALLRRCESGYDAGKHFETNGLIISEIALCLPDPLRFRAAYGHMFSRKWRCRSDGKQEGGDPIKPPWTTLDGVNQLVLQQREQRA